MLKDRTAETLRNRAKSLRLAAARAEDACVQGRIREKAAEFDQLATVIKPVLSSDELNAAQ
jgi:hypothetical protein